MKKTKKEQPLKKAVVRAAEIGFSQVDKAWKKAEREVSQREEFKEINSWELLNAFYKACTKTTCEMLDIPVGCWGRTVKIYMSDPDSYNWWVGNQDYSLQDLYLELCNK